MCPPVPRAADCRPYGGERGCSVIDNRAGTQAGPYAAFRRNPEFLIPNS